MKYVANDEQDEKEFEEYIESLKKVYVLMEEAEIYDKELEKQMSLILNNIKEWDAEIKNSIVKKYLGMANSRLRENKLSIPLENVIQKLGNSLTKYDVENARNGIITMENRNYIEGFIEGVSMCWNNGMKVCPEYTAIYIDTFFIDNDKNNDLNEIIKKKLLQYCENSLFEKKDDNIRKKLEKMNIVFKKNKKYENLIKQNETKADYDRISEFIKLQTEFTVEEIIENLENKADKKQQYWNVRCFFNQITHWFGEPVNFYVAIKKYEDILSEFYAYDVFSAGIIRYKEHLLMIIYGSDE